MPSSKQSNTYILVARQHVLAVAASKLTRGNVGAVVVVRSTSELESPRSTKRAAWFRKSLGTLEVGGRKAYNEEKQKSTLSVCPPKFGIAVNGRNSSGKSRGKKMIRMLPLIRAIESCSTDACPKASLCYTQGMVLLSMCSSSSRSIARRSHQLHHPRQYPPLGFPSQVHVPYREPLGRSSTPIDAGSWGSASP